MALIPKVDHPKKVSNFCLISLCNVCYKIIMKMLANHLKGILVNVISWEQCGFVPRRTLWITLLLFRRWSTLLIMIDPTPLE